MSRVIGYLIVAGLTASPLRGQDVAQMQRRVDSLVREAVLAQKAVIDYRAAHPPLLNFSDSIVAAGGKIKIYFDTNFAAQVRAGFEVADKHLREVGRALDLLPQPLVFSVTPDSLFNPYDQRYKRLREMNVRQHFASAPNTPSRTSVDGDPESIAYVFVRSVAGSLSGRAPSKIAQWTWGTLPIAPDLDATVDWADMRLNMVSSPSRVGPACFFGDVGACRLYLWLDTVPDPIHQLFDALGRRRLVSNEAEGARRVTPVATDRCIAGNDEACVAVLNRIQRIPLGSLSTEYMRSSLVTHAIRLGGPRAAERLLLTPGTPGAALAAAANMPLDSLVVDWQRHLGERSPTGGNVPLTIAISSIAWIALCVFLALRSSRWR